MTLPIKVPTYVSALSEAQEVSVAHKNETIYLFRRSEGYYVIDNQDKEYSNEKLIVKLKNGIRYETN